jgi:hypothetical protein
VGLPVPLELGHSREAAMADAAIYTQIRADIGGIGHFWPSTGGTGQYRAFMGGRGCIRPVVLIYGHKWPAPSHIWTLDLREALREWTWEGRWRTE